MLNTSTGSYIKESVKAAPNKSVQATPMNAAVLPLRSWVGLCHRYGVPDLGRSAVRQCAYV